jgi:hypothetical protein
MFGRKHTSKSGDTSYVGLFWGTIFDEDGSKFRSLRMQAGQLVESDDFNLYMLDVQGAWEKINDKLQDHMTKQIGPTVSPYGWQCGFGGDEMDGLLDFCLPTRIPCPPPMHFTINGIKYTMKFKYSGDDDSDLSSEEQDKDDDY